MLEKSLEHNEVEQEFMDLIEKGQWDQSWVDRELESKGCEIINDFAYKN